MIIKLSRVKRLLLGATQVNKVLTNPWALITLSFDLFPECSLCRYSYWHKIRRPSSTANTTSKIVWEGWTSWIQRKTQRNGPQLSWNWPYTIFSVHLLMLKRMRNCKRKGNEETEGKKRVVSCIAVEKLIEAVGARELTALLIFNVFLSYYITVRSVTHIL